MKTINTFLFRSLCMAMLFITFTACNNDDDNGNDNPTQPTLPVTIELTDLEMPPTVDTAFVIQGFKFHGENIGLDPNNIHMDNALFIGGHLDLDLSSVKDLSKITIKLLDGCHPCTFIKTLDANGNVLKDIDLSVVDITNQDGDYVVTNLSDSIHTLRMESFESFLYHIKLE